MDNEKSVVGLCPRNHKKQFLTYKDALKFARHVNHVNSIDRRKYGKLRGRNASNIVQKNIHINKTCKSIYICKYCGYYHFSSMTKQEAENTYKTSRKITKGVPSVS